MKSLVSKWRESFRWESFSEATRSGWRKVCSPRQTASLQWWFLGVLGLHLGCAPSPSSLNWHPSLLITVFHPSPQAACSSSMQQTWTPSTCMCEEGCYGATVHGLPGSSGQGSESGSAFPSWDPKLIAQGPFPPLRNGNVNTSAVGCSQRFIRL